jgi:TPR repeat protein
MLTLPNVLPIPAVVLLFMGAAFALKPLPASTQARLATLNRLETLKPSDLPRLISEAQSGNPKAEHLLALVYDEGRVIQKDLAAARSWMRKSAEQGYVPAQEGMGEMYLSKVRDPGPIPDYGDAERWLRLAATQGDADAQEWLAHGYEEGWFGIIDYHEALEWYREASDQGLPWAQFAIGEMYRAGEGVPQSNAVAASWYRKAADHISDAGGVWEAEAQLAVMYRDGRLRKDYVQEYMWVAILGSVGSFEDPPTDEVLRRLARHMTKAQVMDAQRLAENWIRRHRKQQEHNVVTSDNSTK